MAASQGTEAEMQTEALWKVTEKRGQERSSVLKLFSRRDAMITP